MKRRNFIKSFGALGFLSLFAQNAFAKKLGEFDTLDAALKSLGFNPDVSGNAYFAAVGDPHLNCKKDENTVLFKKISDELKSMKTAPAFLAVLGDIISNGTKCFADISKNHKQALKEIDIFNECAEYLKPIPAKLVFGNHDTVSPDDFENEVFKKKMPKQKTYYAFDLGKLRCIVLNGHHCAILGKKQFEWLKGEIRQAGERNIAIFIHQPMGSIATESDASRELRGLLDSCKGDVKIICGHIHVNRQELLETPNGKKVAQFALEAPRHNKAPVYWLFCVEDGKIAKAVFRNKDGKFETFDFDLPAKKWETPFEGLGVKASFNPLSPEYSEISVKGWFNSAKCIYFYFYLKEIEFRLDLSKIGKYSQAILMAVNLDGKRGETQFNVSADGKDWFALKPAGREKQFYHVFNLPEKIKNSPVLHFKFATGNVGAIFGGVAVR